MATCKQCNSHAINHHRHGRDGTDGDLCDVCYWQKRAKSINPDLDKPEATHESLREYMLLVNGHEVLLRECLFAFNSIPNKRIPDGKKGTTYQLAQKLRWHLGCYEKTLRYYQSEAVKALMAALKDKAAVPYADLCTGFGKSLVAAHITNIGLNNGRRVLQIVPKRELVEQNYKEAVGYVDEPSKIGICCAALGRRETHKPSIIATPGSFKSGMFKAGAIDLIIIDEAHKVGIDEQGEIRKIVRFLTNKNPDMRIIGMTGSPYRIDQGMLHHQVPKGKEGSRLFTQCCYHSDIKRLISEGYLSEIKNISGSLHADLEGLKGKEYSAG